MSDTQVKRKTAKSGRGDRGGAAKKENIIFFTIFVSSFLAILGRAAKPKSRERGGKDPGDGASRRRPRSSLPLYMNEIDEIDALIEEEEAIRNEYSLTVALVHLVQCESLEFALEDEE